MKQLKQKHKKYTDNNRVLIVDDDVDFADSLQDLLQTRNFNVTTANNIFTAQKLIEEFNPEVALLDIRMGDGNGVDLLRIILKNHPGIVCSILTAHATLDTAIECLRIGAYDYLRKPIKADELFAILERSFEKVKLINDKFTAEKLLYDSEKKYHDLVNNIPGAVYRCANDSSWTMYYISPNIHDISGYSREDFINNKVRSYASIIYPEDIKLVEQKVSDALEKKEPYFIEYRIIHKDTNIRWVCENGQGVFDETLNDIYLDGVIFDNTESHELSEELSHQATHDQLTGLVNRSEFENRLKRVLSSTWQNHTEHALVYLDLDQFKVINDTCGHIAGDELLRQLGAILNREVRKRDTVARLGGDEFGVLMEHCSLKQAIRVADKLKDVITEFRFLWEDKHFNIGASIGLVLIDETSTNITEVLKNADAACYAAKDQGRNRVHVYQVDDIQLARQQGEMQWVSIINRALEEDLFYLVYQPIIPLAKSSRKVEYNHIELLLRISINDDMVAPGIFLPAAERYGVINKIDRWVINSAFHYFSINTDFLESTDEISINISGQSIGDDKFHEFTRDAFEKYNIPHDKICFEITETAAIANLAMANKFINVLKKDGCRFSLDDFGSGLSSFAYLKTLNVDYLKIDGFFVKDINDDSIDYALVKSINDIGHEIGLKTIAEFVENKNILKKLEEIGVDYVQGYYFGKIRKLVESH